jgi:hypothetical protein
VVLDDDRLLAGVAAAQQDHHLTGLQGCGTERMSGVTALRWSTPPSHGPPKRRRTLRNFTILSLRAPRATRNPEKREAKAHGVALGEVAAAIFRGLATSSMLNALQACQRQKGGAMILISHI